MTELDIIRKLKKHVFRQGKNMLIGYMRVSTSDKQQIDLQRDALLASGVDERQIFQDFVSGGSTQNRPGLKEALAYLKKGDTLVVWKLDRLGRSLKDLIEIIENLKRTEIGLKSLTEGMDTTTPQGELFFSIFGALAQFERALIKERVNAGLESSRKRGKIGGRPRAISDEKLEAIKKAIEDGMSIASVCRNFGVKRSTLVDTIKRKQE